MMMFLSVFLAFCLSGFAASSQPDETQFAVWSEPDVVGNSLCGCYKEPIPQCGCRLDIETAGIDYILEMNMTYIEEDNGIQFTVVLNGKVQFNRTFTAKPPSPICSGVCPTRCVCIDYYNISYGEDHKWGGCFAIYADVEIRVVDIKLGCFYLPVNQEEKKTIDKPIQSLLLNEMLQQFQDTFGKKMSGRRLKKKKNPFDVLFKIHVEEDSKESNTLVFN